MASELSYSGFEVVQNPNGIQFNPHSLGVLLTRLIGHDPYQDDDLIQSGHQWYSWEHHHLISSSNPAMLLNRINETFENTRKHLLESKVLIVTFGSAYAYQLRSADRIVANCHKVPGDQFVKTRLSTEHIIDHWKAVISLLNKHVPDLNVIMTVSPVRHKKDGLIENQKSKAILLLAIEGLLQRFPNVHYFPSYEIMMDDLRDYRWYADDMLHPSDMAIKYIWTRFLETYVDRSTQDEMNRISKARRNLAHRPLHADSEEYQKFRAKAEAEWEGLKDSYPHLI